MGTGRKVARNQARMRGKDIKQAIKQFKQMGIAQEAMFRKTLNGLGFISRSIIAIKIILKRY